MISEWAKDLCNESPSTFSKVFGHAFEHHMVSFSLHSRFFLFTSLFGQEESGADIFFWTCACRVPLESLNFGNVPAVLLGIAGHLI